MLFYTSWEKSVKKVKVTPPKVESLQTSSTDLISWQTFSQVFGKCRLDSLRKSSLIEVARCLFEKCKHLDEMNATGGNMPWNYNSQTSKQCQWAFKYCGLLMQTNYSWDYLACQCNMLYEMRDVSDILFIIFKHLQLTKIKLLLCKGEKSLVQPEMLLQVC